MDENWRGEGWNSYFKFLSLTFMLSGGILYYIPLSRAYFCKGCHIFIDAVAFSLKSALNAFENESKRTRRDSASLARDSKDHDQSRDSREGKRHRRRGHRIKNRIAYKEAKERNGEWSTVQLYPGRGFELQRDSLVDLKWNKGTSRQSNDDVLHLENDVPPENYNHLLIPSVGDIKSSRRSKLVENLKKKKHERNRQVSYQVKTQEEKEEDEESYKLNEKLRKLRRRIRSMVSVPDKSFREQKEVEALKLIEDLLRDTSDKVELKHHPLLPIEDEKAYEVINVDSSRSDRKFTSSTKKKSPSGVGRGDQEIPELELEGLAVDSDYSLQTPIITDRVTPILRNTYQWLFGGCPSSSHHRR